MPERIQLSRAKGWRKPEGAIVVARPTVWGNPFRVDSYGHQAAVILFERLMAGRMSAREMMDASTCNDIVLSAYRRRAIDNMGRLTGHDLCCWCSPKQMCHADVLIEMANQ